MKFCSFCNTQAENDFSFCVSCGATLPANNDTQTKKITSTISTLVRKKSRIFKKHN